ncbi:hypothetical protein CVT24_009808 [Panaeolus cyanescens]|uniref:F-box domain-containing protein n=1 Tax=Panaeolus cyanescens TaxID=181874 RepID=A0A409VAB8_9AGAR|nr:hypothetical protein CVT24_009808 [Panaeolus cyanescens]
MSTSSRFEDVPIEVLIDNIFPLLPVQDLLYLTCCNKFFSIVCSDDTLWRRKLVEDFNFTGESTARTSGWKFIYSRLSNPKVFVWGDKGNARLGLPVLPKSVLGGGIPYPVPLKIPARIVKLAAGGMYANISLLIRGSDPPPSGRSTRLIQQGTFMSGVSSFIDLLDKGPKADALTQGTLDGSIGYNPSNVGFSSPFKQASQPMKLVMPSPIRSISCGRLHSSCLDKTNKIWTFTRWGRPFWLSSPILAEPEYRPIQIECGWVFSSFLTKSGDVFVWWPSATTMRSMIQAKMQEMDQQVNSTIWPDGNTIPCAPWALDMMPFKLPSIPALPPLQQSNSEGEERNVHLIQIAGFDCHIVGLTNEGHVLKYGQLHDEVRASEGRWEYLPEFSELDKVKSNPIFVPGAHALEPQPPATLKITHVTADFAHFIAYSTGSHSTVLIGDRETTPSSVPKLIPELQNKSVISVAIGDYHSAALTADGKLFTWGKYCTGALGLGDPLELEPGTPGAFVDERVRTDARQRGRTYSTPPDVTSPTEVRFDHFSKKKPLDRFCFAVTAAGWHTGALVIDLEVSSTMSDINSNL